MCSALLLHPVAAYSFNFGGGGLQWPRQADSEHRVSLFLRPVAGVSSQQSLHLSSTLRNSSSLQNTACKFNAAAWL